MNFSGAIPTLYKGIQFRSRAEAKWAAFFDLLKWEWAYEPVDLPGYIPDFSVGICGSLLEVKGGVLTPDELRSEVYKLEERTNAEILVVGAHPMWDWDGEGEQTLGLFANERWGWGGACDPLSAFVDKGVAAGCEGGHVGYIASQCSYACRICGMHDGDHHLRPLRTNLKALWAEACNASQWRRPA